MFKTIKDIFDVTIVITAVGFIIGAATASFMLPIFLTWKLIFKLM